MSGKIHWVVFLQFEPVLDMPDYQNQNLFESLANSLRGVY